MKAQSFPFYSFLSNLQFFYALASICNRLRFTVRTSTHLKSSNAHSFPSRQAVALRIASTAHNHHTTRPLLRHRRCWILEKCWTLLVRQRLPVALGKIDYCLSLGNTQCRSAKKNRWAYLTQHVFDWVSIDSFCMGAAWRDLAGRKSNFNKILGYVTEIR